MHDEFKKFAGKEFNLENILYYDTIQELLVRTRRQKSQAPLDELKLQQQRQDLISFAKQIHVDFIATSGAYALNITPAQVSKFNTALATNDTEQIMDALITTWQKVTSNMVDMYTRFATTQVCKEWKKRRDLEAQAKKDLGWQDENNKTTPATPAAES